MSRELVQKFMQHPLALAGIAIAIILILALAILFLYSGMRRRRSQRETELQSELKQMEHERQFASATNGLPHERSSAEAARHISDLFGEHLWSRVLGIFAARPGEQEARNLVPESLLAGTEYAALIPSTIASSLLAQFAWPRVAKLSLITGTTGSPKSPEAP